MSWLGKKASEALDKADPKNPLVMVAKGVRAVDRAAVAAGEAKSAPVPGKLYNENSPLCPMPSGRGGKQCGKRKTSINAAHCGSVQCANIYTNMLAAEDGDLNRHRHATVMRDTRKKR